MTVDDMTLLREFASSQSEPAFAALVERHIGLVHSAALRQTGDAHLAEEITQAVFIILARKAASLGANTILPAWLYRTTRYAASNALKIRRRRQAREQEAYMQSTLDRGGDADDAWRRLAPLLDDAMADLAERDRAAVVLRYFENRPWREVAALLRVTEDAAQKRVTRALEKLRGSLTKRGVTVTVAIIAGAISINSVQATPAGLAKTITAVAAVKGTTASVSTLTVMKGALKIMAWTKTKTVIVVGVAAILAVGTTTMVRHQMQHGHLPKPQPVAENVTEYPKASWHFAGYDDPDSAFMSCMWAVNLGDSRTLLASVSPSEQQRLLRGKQIITAKDRTDYAAMTNYRIVNRQVVSEDKVILEVETSLGKQTAKFLLQRIDGEWKFAGKSGE